MIGRPQQTEAASYYFNYINQAPGDDPLDLLTSQLDQLGSFLSTISEDRSLYRYAPDKWSIRQVLNHVTDTERAFAFRTLWFARGFSTALPGFDQEIAAGDADAGRVSWAAHIEEFQQVRLSTISLVRNLPPQAWMRTGVASDNSFTVRALAFIIVGHVAHHAAVLLERYS
jgi:hypothetical protein